MFTQSIQCTIAACLLLIIAAGSWFWLKKANTTQDILTLGTMGGWPPFVSINTEGTYEGFDIDVAQEIARRLKKTLVITDMDTAALITALNQGSVDFIMTGLDMTAERMQKITMIPYQGDPITEFPLIFWKQVPKGITSLADLKNIPNAIICVESGSSQEGILQQYSGFETCYSDPLGSIMMLQYGKAHAVLLERKLLNKLKEKFPELIDVSIALDEKNKMLGCGIGIKKTNAALTAQIESIIADLKKSGDLKQKELQWFGATSSQTADADANKGEAKATNQVATADATTTLANQQEAS